MATEPDEGQPAAANNAPGGVAGPRPADQRRPADPRRRVLLLTPIVAIIVGLAVGVANLPADRPVTPGQDSPSPSTTAMAVVPGYLVSPDELRRRSEMAALGEEPYASAVVNLMEWAHAAVDDVARPT